MGSPMANSTRKICEKGTWLPRKIHSAFHQVYTRWWVMKHVFFNNFRKNVMELLFFFRCKCFSLLRNLIILVLKNFTADSIAVTRNQYLKEMIAKISKEDALICMKLRLPVELTNNRMRVYNLV
jgi:hypothetical protein